MRDADGTLERHRAQRCHRPTSDRSTVTVVASYVPQRVANPERCRSRLQSPQDLQHEEPERDHQYEQPAVADRDHPATTPFPRPSLRVLALFCNSGYAEFQSGGFCQASACEASVRRTDRAGRRANFVDDRRDVDPADGQRCLGSGLHLHQRSGSSSTTVLCARFRRDRSRTPGASPAEPSQASPPTRSAGSRPPNR